MLEIFESLLPIFVLVLLGTAFRRYDFPAQGFWVAADRLTYYVFLPALLTKTLATATFTLEDFYNLTGVLCASVMVVALMALLLQQGLRSSAATFTSIFQGSIRPNTYVALAASTALFGAKGLALTSIIMAGVIPLVNILSVAAFAFFVPTTGRRTPTFFRSILTNPLVIACAVGIVLNISGIGLPFVSEDVFDIMSRPALPMGLISVGYGLLLGGSRTKIIPTMIAGTLKLAVLPLLTYLMLMGLNVSGISLQVAILFASTPCAVSSYILAGHLNGDQETMATIITLETLIAFVTMPLLLVLIG